MATLFTKTKLYLEANSKTWDDTKVSLQNNSDGNGDFISSWTYDGLAKPSDSQIASYETAGNAAEALAAVLVVPVHVYEQDSAISYAPKVVTPDTLACVDVGVPTSVSGADQVLPLYTCMPNLDKLQPASRSLAR